MNCWSGVFFRVFLNNISMFLQKLLCSLNLKSLLMSFAACLKILPELFMVICLPFSFQNIAFMIVSVKKCQFLKRLSIVVVETNLR